MDFITNFCGLAATLLGILGTAAIFALGVIAIMRGHWEGSFLIVLSIAWMAVWFTVSERIADWS